MKICNNCNTLNELRAQQCVHCRMPGNFSVQDVPAAAEPETAQRIQCRNCGTFEPGFGPACVQCRFPLPQQRAGTRRDMPAGRERVSKPN